MIKTATEIIAELIKQFDNDNNGWNQKSAIEHAQQYLATTPAAPENDMTAKDFFNDPDGMFTLNFLNEKEQETLLKGIELYAMGKVRQSPAAPSPSREDEIESLKIFSSLYEDCSIERDRYRKHIIGFAIFCGSGFWFNVLDYEKEQLELMQSLDAAKAVEGKSKWLNKEEIKKVAEGLFLIMSEDSFDNGLASYGFYKMMIADKQQAFVSGYDLAASQFRTQPSPTSKS